MKKKYISSQSLLEDSLKLAMKIAESNFSPDLIIGVWRGGTPIAIAIQEALEFIGFENDHIAIRTASYSGIAERNEVKVDGLDYVENNLGSINSILLVDDVFDTGLSLDRVIFELDSLGKSSSLDIKIAAPYFKPTNNKTERTPNYYLHETADWLVFPHELLGLEDHEILQEKPGISSIHQRLLTLRKLKSENT